MPVLPLYFEPNGGQADPDVRFLARAPGGTLQLTQAAVTLQAGGRNVGLRPLNANPSATIEGFEPTRGKSNYLVGANPRRWRLGIPHYAKVRYRDIYPGIDLVFYGNQRRLEYDWVVHPGASPSSILVRFEGTKSVRLTAAGDLAIATDRGVITQHKPVLYQHTAGGRAPVDGRYVMRGPNQAGFAVDSYDPSLDLIIDPVLSFATYLGGGGDDLVQAVALDSAGNVYLTGGTGSTNFPLRSPLRSTNTGGDVFVTKIDPTGASIVYSTYLGGSAQEVARAIAVDAEGNAYVTGETASADYPTRSAFQSAARAQDAFLTKLNAAGDGLVYSTYFGGAAAEFGFGIAVDGSGAAYLAGQTASMDFPLRTPVQAAFGGGSTDAFVAKFSPAGGLVFSTYLGGAGGDAGYAVTVDAAGRAHAAGSTGSNAYPVVNPIQRTRAGQFDGFICRFNAAGSALEFSTYHGGDLDDQIYAIALDAAGNVLVSGATGSEDFPLRQPVQMFHGGAGEDAFVSKLDSSGTNLIYSTYLGGRDVDRSRGLGVDPAGNAWITGSTASDNFPVAGSLQQRRARDAFVTKLSPVGAILFSTFYGGEGDETGVALAVDGRGDVIVTGTTTSTGLPVMNALQPRYAGGARDAFLFKLAEDGAALLTMVSAASFTGDVLAPESIVAAYGAGLAPSTEVAPSAALPESLAGVSVRVRDSAGIERSAGLFFVSSGQINFVMPPGTADGTATVSVYQGDTLVARGTVRIERVAPSLFTANANGRGVAAALVLRVRGGNQSTALIFQCAAAGSCTGSPVEPESAEEQVFLLLFGTGIRNASAQSAVRATVGG
ncbi:MAG: SBBP repeat-containing protein, partial [Bryobacteraceae bacterium]